VSLDSSKSLALYRKKLTELRQEIASLDDRIAKATVNERYGFLTQALTVIEQYEKYRAVAQLLGETQFTASPRTRSDTEAQLREVEKSAPSIELAAQILAKGLKTNTVYIYPAVPHVHMKSLRLVELYEIAWISKLLLWTARIRQEHFLRGSMKYLIADSNLPIGWWMTPETRLKLA